jgi:NAD(P)-dependent dehydrogenase (short-subunit alcohol dehydrogenase family)
VEESFMIRKDKPASDPQQGQPLHRPQMQDEPRPPFPAQKQPKPGLEADMAQRPHFEADRYIAAGKLHGKAALITGGDSGIGRAVAVLYAREGADVAIVYLPSEQVDADETRHAVESHGRRCVLIAGDLADPQFCRDAVDQAARELGKLDILVSNAAHQNRKQHIEEVTDEEWRRTFAVNIDAYFHLVKAAMPHLKPGSAIIATSSVVAYEGNQSLPDYSATKGAINSLTKVLGRMLAERGIRCNAVAPGPVWTPLNLADRGASPQKVEQFGADTPMQRPGQPEEIAPAYVFLASDADSSYITGAILPQTGGDAVA